VINGSTRVAPDIRAAIEAAIDQVGYVPNRAARSLVTRRTDSIALVVREPVEFGVADPYLSSIVVAASQSLVGTGIQLAVMMARDDEDHARLGAYVRGGTWTASCWSPCTTTTRCRASSPGPGCPSSSAAG
jgi:DNA-binding LacI/PurR family transcriptional regulator